MADLRECIAVAFESHGDQLDKASAPYLIHVACVALSVPERCQSVAWLHDVVEDDWRSYSNSQIGAINQVAERCRLSYDEERALWLLTRPPSMDYPDYIRRIAQAHGDGGRIARLVKMADLKDNLARLGSLPAMDAERLRPRYEGAIAALPAGTPL